MSFCHTKLFWKSTTLPTSIHSNALNDTDLILELSNSGGRESAPLTSKLENQRGKSTQVGGGNSRVRENKMLGQHSRNDKV